MKRCLKALALLIVVVGSSGWATEKRILVSTWDVTDTLYVSFSTGQYYRGEEHDLAQKFTTGTQTGYRVTNVRHDFGTSGGCFDDPKNPKYKVSLREDNNGEPGDKLSDITNGAVGDHGWVLSASTHYWILFDYLGGGDCGIFGADNRDHEDSAGLSGWALDDGHNRDRNDNGDAFPDTVKADSWQEVGSCDWCRKQYTIRLRLWGTREVCATSQHTHDAYACHATGTVHCSAGQHKHDGLACHATGTTHCPAGQHAHDGRSCHAESEDHSTPTPPACPAGQHQHDGRPCHAESENHNPNPGVGGGGGSGGGGGGGAPRSPSCPEGSTGDHPDCTCTDSGQRYDQSRNVCEERPKQEYTVKMHTMVRPHNNCGPSNPEGCQRPDEAGEYKIGTVVDGPWREVTRYSELYDAANVVWAREDACYNNLVEGPRNPCVRIGERAEELEQDGDDETELLMELSWQHGPTRPAFRPLFDVLGSKVSKDMNRCVVSIAYAEENEPETRRPYDADPDNGDFLLPGAGKAAEWTSASFRFNDMDLDASYPADCDWEAAD